MYKLLLLIATILMCSLYLWAQSPENRVPRITDEVFQLEDDGFDVPLLQSKWSQVFTGTAPAIAINPPVARSRYQVRFAGVSPGSVSLSQAITLSGDCSITSKWNAQLLSSGTQLYMYLANSTGTDGALLTALRNGTSNIEFRLTNLFTGSQVASLIVGPIQVSGSIYLHLQRVSATFSALASFDGTSWLPLPATFNRVTTLNLVQVTIQQAGAPTKEIIALDWFRRDWLFW